MANKYSITYYDISDMRIQANTKQMEGIEALGRLASNKPAFLECKGPMPTCSPTLHIKKKGMMMKMKQKKSMQRRRKS